MARDGFKIDPGQPIGRQAAGSSFLEAYFRFSGNNVHRIVVPHRIEANWFHEQATNWEPKCLTEAVTVNEWGKAAQTSGSIHIPDALLDTWAWRRMPHGDGAFSLIGIVHTLCCLKTQQSLGQFTNSPLRHWDALICTSKAAQESVNGFLERQEEWIRKRHNGTQFERPLLPIIPLGIHPEKWGPYKSTNETKQKARQTLGIRPNAEIVLLVGRLDLLTKTQPSPLLRVMGALQEEENPNLELLIYGEAPNPEMRQRWAKGAKQIAPNLKIHWIPGSAINLSTTVRWAADIFVSLSDNPQETFGITPLEAMAAGLPCLVSDWDGYRDTVIQPGQSDPPTGIRVTTRIVEGLGGKQVRRLLNGTIGYDQAVGQIAQGIAVDVNEFKKSLLLLLSHPELRKSMGDAGRKRVESKFAWKIIIEEWRSLTTELNARRNHAIKNNETSPAQMPPWLQDTSVSFGCFASEILPKTWNPNPPDRSIENKLISNPLQSWDKSLLNEYSARRRGWWLKQGLINF